MRDQWHILTVRTREELTTAEKLDRLGFRTFVPRVLARRKHRRSKSWQEKLVPLFFGYLFLQAGTIVNWRGVFGVDGVTGVLEGAKGDDSFSPVTLPHSVLEELLAGVDDLRLHPEFPNLMFAEGDKVRITDGPLSGLKGTVKKTKKNAKEERVTLELFPRCNTQKVEIPALLLEFTV